METSRDPNSHQMLMRWWGWLCQAVAIHETLTAVLNGLPPQAPPASRGHSLLMNFETDCQNGDLRKNKEWGPTNLHKANFN